MPHRQKKELDLPGKKIISSGFGMALLLLGGANAVSHVSLNQFAETSRLVEYTYQVEDSLESITSDLKDAEAGRRSYITTGEKRQLEAYNAAIKDIARQIQNFRQLTADNAAQQRRIDILEPLVAKKVAWLQESINKRKTQGNNPQKQIALSKYSQEAEETINQLLLQMHAEEDKLLQQRSVAAALSHQRTQLGIYLANSVGFLLLIGVYFLLMRAIAFKQQAKKERSRLVAILEASTDCVSIIDSQGNILWQNSQFKQLTGTTTDAQVLPHPISNYNPQWARDIVHNEGIPAAIRDGVWVGETALLRTDGTEMPVSQMIIAHKSSQGEVEYLSTVVRDITPLNQAAEHLRASLKEKEVMLKEIHHRVKNNLQIISSLLKLQSQYISDEQARALFANSYNRVKAMALLHEKLYRVSDLALINAADYISSLTAELFSSYSLSAKDIDLKQQVDEIWLDIDTAIPCGLIITELVSNSLKYAFPSSCRGEVCIQLLIHEQQLTLIVSDNGVGLPPDFEIEEAESLGLQLVSNLAQQLSGSLEIDSSGGTCFQIAFTPRSLSTNKTMTQAVV